MSKIPQRSLELQQQRNHRSAALKFAAENGIKVISRQEAIALGLTRYFSLKMCPKAHLSERYVSKSQCIACINEQNEAWRDGNREAYLAGQVRWRIQRRKTDPLFALELRARALVKNALARRGFKSSSRTAEVLGCTWEAFKIHIERQFLPGMSWENFSEWEIDHITPMATAKTEQDVLALSHMTNLRPLWRPDNQRKSDNITHLI